MTKIKKVLSLAGKQLNKYSQSILPFIRNNPHITKQFFQSSAII